MRLVEVAVGVIVKGDKVFVAKRPDHLDQGGCWEFPGGKLESGESAPQALRRELAEELGIEVQQVSPLEQITHEYAQHRVRLAVMWVERFTGEPRGAEGQVVAWVGASELAELVFPAANHSITAQVLTRLRRLEALGDGQS